MPYDYATQRAELFTETGVRMLDDVRRDVRRALSRNEVVLAGSVLASGDAWTSLAALDYMVERGEIREISGSGVMGQHRVFTTW